MLNDKEKALATEARLLLGNCPFLNDEEIFEEEGLAKFEETDVASMARFTECYDHEFMRNVTLQEVVGSELDPIVGLISGRMIGIVFESSLDPDTYIVIDEINQELLFSQSDGFSEENIVSGDVRYINLFQDGLNAIRRSL